ncbi:PREDICTED: kinesin-like protein KIN-14S [Lupinus angustifolius]|uniref:kinesin-like protein KIN-14S n=1 Tax=Lupinus angustifolius TaxID=3871 RepID=UPI00092E4609|nr:PREDICTED: kinesin-like protein KIN-14S [Lupinus angustifolius]
MNDLTIQTEILNPLLLQCDLEDHPYSIAPSEVVPNQLSENPNCIGSENIMSNEIHENSPDQGHGTVPISKKILYLSTIVQDLKNQHLALSDEVKLTIESFPGPDFLKSVQLLGSENDLLKRKLLVESSERRHLYNEVIELKGNIKVFCRCRPLNESEIANGSASVVNFESLPDNELQVICSDSSKKQFKFDNIFRPEDNQEAVFAQTKPIVTSVLDGFNVCIFAYGQTGTGKTFTMEGTPEQRGVNYRTLEELFRLTEERHGITKYELRVSMLEVYNEKIRDLLAENSSQPTKKLEIKQAADGTQEVPGLIEAPVNGTEDVWEILKVGNGVRSVGSTCSNELSSPSHCLLRVTVVGESLINGQKTKSRLWLVDLAGSERVGKTEAEGERLKESQFINKSLSALGDVISALASKSAHIPYRNSKLTHILQSSLGGDCKTLMFVQVSPSTADLGETLCSLNFATRVRGIESGPARKQVDLTELLKYKQMAEKAKHDDKETRKLQDNLQNLQLRLAARDYHCKNLQEKVRDLENQIAEERKTRLKQESRSLAAVSAQPSSSKQTAVQKIITNKKPPLNPSKSRPPLRRITNLLRPSSPLTSKRYTAAMNGKENTVRRRNSMTTNTESFAKPRGRASIAVPVRPPASSTTTQILQPRRRVSIAALHPDTAYDMTTPLRTSPSRPSAAPTQVLQPRRRVSVATIRSDTTYDIKTPLRTSASQFNSGIGLQQSLKNNQRKDRYSSLFAQYSELRASSVETTPMSIGSSSKFRGSPVRADSRLARHPTGLALQRKPLVWSPLKLKASKNNRKLLWPSRPYTEMQ